MNANPMTEQVNRLIANRLAAGCELFLPGVGSLYVEQRGARRLDDRCVAPPCRTVNFIAQEQGTSLVDEIARAARCEPEKAQEIYDRWLDAVLGERTLTIEGVGELRGSRFNPDPEFDLLLNPQGRTPVTVKTKRHDRTLWVALLAIVAAAAIGYFAFFAGNRPLPESVRSLWQGEAESEEPIQRVDLSTGMLVDAATGEPLADSVENAAPVRPAQAVPEQPAAVEEPRAQGSVESPARFVPGRHYVVCGVFAEAKNAARAVAEAESGGLTCGVYRFNGKLLVSPFESDDLAACQRFMRAHRAQWPDVWTYSAR